MSQCTSKSAQFTGFLSTAASDPSDAVDEAFEGIVNFGFPTATY